MMREPTYAELMRYRAKRSTRMADREERRCKYCPLPLVRDGDEFRHADEAFAGEKLHGHKATARRKYSTSTTVRMSDVVLFR